MAYNSNSTPYDDINDLSSVKNIKGKKQNEKPLNEKPQGKTKAAVAIAYSPADEAPKIIATGRGILADKIIDAAKEADIPLHEDKRLVETLSKLDIGDYIPQELYEVVAEILLFVDKLDRIKEKVNKKT